MMNYRKGRNIEKELTRHDISIECLPANFLWMHVKGGTTVSNVVEFAKKALQTGEHRAVVWTGYGGGVGKTISSVEILKREFTLHQITKLCFKTDEEYWDPLTEGLEPIVVRRNIPCIHILISLDPVDQQMPGYQFSKDKTTFWQDHVSPGDGPSSSSSRLPSANSKLFSNDRNSNGKRRSNNIK